MARPRTDLDAILRRLLQSDNVYFNPPENVRLRYPCIRYTLDEMDVKRADNSPYHIEKRYSITLIDSDPDNIYIDRLIETPNTSFERSYVSDGLYHYVYTLYY